jgi:hypothetical protein
MDCELASTTESRGFFQVDGVRDNRTEEGLSSLRADDTISRDVHVLGSLMQSLEASGGGSGPVVNMMKEMQETKK